MLGALPLAGERVLGVALFTAVLCAAVTVAMSLAAGEVAYAAWLGLVGALIGLLGGVVAGLGAVAAGALLTRGDALDQVRRWIPPLVGGLCAGACVALVLPGAALQGALAAVGVFLMAATAVAACTAKCHQDAVRH